MFYWKKIPINSLAYIKSQFKEKHMDPQKVHICHSRSGLNFSNECNLLRSKNIIYFMSNRWPTFDSHRVQEFFKRYEIKVSNILCSHIWPVCFPNSCSDLFIFFCWLLSNWSQEQARSKSYFIYTYVCIYTCLLVCQWSQPVTWWGQHRHHRAGLGYWRRATRWWPRGLGGEEQGEIQWYKAHAIFQPMLETKEEQNWDVLCSDRGCYCCDAAVAILGWSWDTPFPGQTEKHS